ncbi:PREDICTED: low affinity immunoglobulin gamma Fc region receptor III-like [Elephantulus edwardii]|uniref:low affinity immunoglobulin gamma Fc region receptor III-like n=1 Tax=Elephantulus edwardii TaxID=28737 RepID=UPI0003F0D2F1|nr:PREDICTED: low affinity immunoglobulin gamma Fc region receptor III-like [Elephantulus edwardii]
MWQLLPPTALLLVVSADLEAADPSKAVVSLDPPWYRLLQQDKVTLKCQGTYLPGENSTQWWHNDNATSVETSSYFIASAKTTDSGEYRCKTGLSTLSDPVKLKVYADWLVLQAVKSEFQEGERIELRCHTWKNKPVHKVTYLQNGTGRKFSHQNTMFHIPKATYSHSGTYFCRGLIGNKNVSSVSLNITVKGVAIPSISPFFPPWHQIAFCLLMALLFAVDTGLYLSVRKLSLRLMKPQIEMELEPSDK